MTVVAVYTLDTGLFFGRQYPNGLVLMEYAVSQGPGNDRSVSL